MIEKYFKKISKDFKLVDDEIGKMLVYHNDESLKFKLLVLKREFIYFKIQLVDSLFKVKK